MPKEVQEFTILVSSPSDVSADRDAIEEVVDELNDLLKSRNVRLKAWRWESDAAAGVGEEAQDVIRRSYTVDSFDILVGLFGSKLGTPTLKAPSGTVSEIREALAKDGRHYDNHHVQVYFKSVSVDIYQIDESEVSRLKEFRRELQDRGVLYRNYSNEKELMDYVRSGLNRAIEAWIRNQGLRESPPATHSSNVVLKHEQPTERHTKLAAAESDEQDFGILDYIEDFESRIQRATDLIEKIGVIHSTMGDYLNQKLASVGDMSLLSADRKKKVINEIAQELDNAATDILTELTDANTNFQQAINSNIKAIQIQIEDNPQLRSGDEFTGLIANIDNLLLITASNEKGLVDLREIISGTPRLTKEYNRAKRKMLEATDQYVEFYQASKIALDDFKDRLTKI